MLSSVRVVFFDAGGTLFHPHPSAGAIYQRVAARYGSQASASALEQSFRRVWAQRDKEKTAPEHANKSHEKQWWRSLVREVFAEVGQVADFDAFFEEVYDEFGHPDSWRLLAGVHEVLEELRRRGKRLAIISNWDPRLFDLCKGLGLDDYFEFILASSTVGVSKPSPRIFREALRRAAVAPHESAHVGDSLSDDVEGALSVGIKAVWLDAHGGPPPANGARVFHRINELRGLLA